MATLSEITVPDIGDFKDVPVTEVMVAVGDHVEPEDPLVALESDKATMEVPSPQAGTIQELRVSVGDRVSEGSLLIVLSIEDAPGEDREASPEGQVDREGRGDAEEPPRVQRAPRSADPQTQAQAQAAPPPPAQPTNGRVYAGPSVRRRAHELGLALETVAGSGPKGRITLEDIERAGQRGGTATGEGLGLAPWPVVDFERYGEVERVELSKIKRMTGANLARNWVRIPHVTHHEDADITDLEEFRKRINSEQSQVKVTMVALLLKACAVALARFPRLNSSLDGDQLVLKRYYHLGFAADTPAGLVVPVVRDVEGKGLIELAGELTELSGRAREGKLTPAEMSGASFTISSLGGIGGTSFTPIINAPEVAILGVVRSAVKPVWDGQEFVPRLILPLSLSYDHRVVDGAEAARFCAHLAQLLADMRRTLL